MPARPPAEHAGEDGIRPATIFIVEDDRSVGQFVKRYLTLHGYTVIGVAASGEDAIAALEAGRPDLIILDIRLEGPMDGVELAGVIRARWAVPILYLTGKGDDETVRRAVSTGPVGFVRKPFDDIQLRAAVEVALHHVGEDKARDEALERTQRETEALAATTASAQQRLRRIAEVVGVESKSDAASLPPHLFKRLNGASPREIDVLRHLLAGHRVTSMSRSMDVSPFTVRNHLRALFRKVDVHSQGELLDLFRGVSPHALDALTRRRPARRTDRSSESD